MKSLVNNKNYTGSINNLDRRLKKHNLGKSKYTKLTKPFRLIYQEEFQTRLKAKRRELFFKTGKGRELIKMAVKKGT